MIDDRKLIGHNMPPNEPVHWSRYSATVGKSYSKTMNKIVELVESHLPVSLKIDPGDMRETVLERYREELWLNEIYKHGQKEPLNEMDSGSY